MVVNIAKWLSIMFLLADIAIFFDIQFARQIFGFLFLTILPGILILPIIKLDKIGYTEKFVLSIGLSVSFLMFFGLAINNMVLNLGYERPLTTTFLLISLNLAFIILMTIGYKLNNKSQIFLPNLNLRPTEKAFLSVSILFPALSIFGMRIMDSMDDNIILKLLLISIIMYISFICVFNRKFSQRLYPIVIFLISISILLLLSLRSNYILGIDTHAEYDFFSVTLNNLHWNILGYSSLDATLSISLLPAMYQSILNVNPEFLFKVIYSIIYSITPLAIYILSKRYIVDHYAFLASCFFMFQYNFFWTAANARTNMAILFFILAMMVLFSDRIELSKKRILLLIFVASSIVSHYSTSYIFFFLMLATLIGVIGVEIFSKRWHILQNLLDSYIMELHSLPPGSIHNNKKDFGKIFVLIFFIMIFFWYSQVTGSAFNAGSDFVRNTFGNLNKFFIEESRGESVKMLLGNNILTNSIAYQIEFVFRLITFIFIGIGIITHNLRNSDLLKARFNIKYIILALACFGLLVMMMVIPYIAIGYSIDRTYAVTLTILSVFFVIGGIRLSQYFKVQGFIVVLAILIPYFLSVSGLSYTFFNDQRSIILTSGGKLYDLMYIHDQEFFSAKWLEYNINNDIPIYSDIYGARWLVTLTNLTDIKPIKHALLYHKNKNRYIYLRYQNIIKGELVDYRVKIFKMEDYKDEFNRNEIIYDNGISKIQAKWFSE